MRAVVPWIAGWVMAALSMEAQQAMAHDLASYRWTSRILVVFAPRAAHPGLIEQRRLYRAMGNGAHERDLVLVEEVGASPEAGAVRARFGVDNGFAVLLIGKDGGEKLRSDRPLDEAALFPVIDAMPMRQAERQRQRP